MGFSTEYKNDGKVLPSFFKKLLLMKLLIIVICTLFKTPCTDGRKSRATMHYSSHELKEPMLFWWLCAV
jgi:hypothetical protein